MPGLDPGIHLPRHARPRAGHPRLWARRLALKVDTARRANSKCVELARDGIQYTVRLPASRRFAPGAVRQCDTAEWTWQGSVTLRARTQRAGPESPKYRDRSRRRSWPSAPHAIFSKRYWTRLPLSVVPACNCGCRGDEIDCVVARLGGETGRFDAARAHARARVPRNFGGRSATVAARSCTAT